jgi:hypothetical protein
MYDTKLYNTLIAEYYRLVSQAETYVEVDKLCRVYQHAINIAYNDILDGLLHEIK